MNQSNDVKTLELEIQGVDGELNRRLFGKSDPERGDVHEPIAHVYITYRSESQRGFMDLHQVTDVVIQYAANISGTVLAIWLYECLKDRVATLRINGRETAKEEKSIQEAIEESQVSPNSTEEFQHRSKEIKQQLIRSPVDFVIVTPLPEERKAILRHLGNPKRIPPVDDDIRTYYPSRVPVTFSDGSRGEYKIIVTDLLGMGRVETANAVGDAIRRWKPRYLFVVGIAGGLARAKVTEGDVLVAEQIADYELQKLTPEKISVRWSVHRVDPRLLGAAKQMDADDWQPLISAIRPKAGKPSEHFGAICTGDKIIANGLLDEYAHVWTKLIGVEMEAGGAASAAFQSAKATGFFMVRGVSDLADGDKDMPQTQSWRNYACDIAAAYTVGLLRSGPIPINP